MGGVNDGRKNDGHEGISEEGGFKMSEDTTFCSDGVIAIKGKDDEKREEKIEEDGGVFEMAEGNVRGVPTKTREVGDQKRNDDRKKI